MPLLQDESEFRRRIRNHEAETAYEHIAMRVENAKIQIEELDIEVTEVNDALSHRLDVEED